MKSETFYRVCAVVQMPLIAGFLWAQSFLFPPFISAQAAGGMMALLGFIGGWCSFALACSLRAHAEWAKYKETPK